MKKLILLSVIFAFVCSFSGFAQTGNQIELKKKRYYQNDKKLTNKELKSILMSNPESAVEYNLAKKNSSIGAIPAMAGSVLVLYGTVVNLKQSVEESNAISNGNLYYQSDPSKYVTPMLIGCALGISSIPFALASNKHLKKSVSIYNSQKTLGYDQKLEFGITQNGVSLVYKF
jgi:hypothetical protein